MLTSLVIIPEFFVTFASVTKEREGEKRKEARKKIGVLFLLIFSFIPVLVYFLYELCVTAVTGKNVTPLLPRHSSPSQVAAQCLDALPERHSLR